MFSPSLVALNETGHVNLACKQSSELAKYTTLWKFGMYPLFEHADHF